MGPSDTNIELKNVSTNNLNGIDVSFPLGKISVVTGVSGSGKSSLVFDTLYGESYRRYVESLSSFARQYLKSLPKPEVEEVKNLPSAIAVKQNKSQGNNRSSVGTLTELNDLLRVVFVHLAVNYCENCQLEVRKDTPESIVSEVLAQFNEEKVFVCASLAKWGKMTAKALKCALEAQGFVRVLVEDSVQKIQDTKAADLKNSLVIVDRINVSKASKNRISAAAGLALKLGQGFCEIRSESNRQMAFSTTLTCLSCNRDYLEPSMALLSYNHPLGACATCQGFGMEAVPDWDKIIPDESATLNSKGIGLWNFGKYSAIYRTANESAKKNGIPHDKPFKDYTQSDKDWLLNGEKTGFKGINGFFAYLDRKKYRPAYRMHASRYRKYVSCSGCDGDRLNAMALSCKIDGLNLGEVSRKSINAIAIWLKEIKKKYGPKQASQHKAHNETFGSEEAVEESLMRTEYLLKIGVGYLSLNRGARTLSGGELQRINMARCLGSSLTSTLFCLDEPTTGLHPRDSKNLLSIINDLKNQGNTIVLVEHESTIIQGADYLIEIGPRAGHEGGNLVYAGKPKKSSLRKIDFQSRTAELGPFIKLTGVSTHNLKNVDIEFPTKGITVVCGVSGSGKTSLIQHSLYPLLAKTMGLATEKNNSYSPEAKSISPAGLIRKHEDVLLVSQASLGRSSRSNIATYLGLMDVVRKEFAAQPRAKLLKLKPGSFSFNTVGGRCETCKGLGTVVEDLSFLGEMEVICPICEGRRFGEDVLSVDLRGRNLNDILRMTVAEIRSFFFEIQSVVKICDIVINMGLGYITLGQNTSSFSGGEAQRLKLVSLMKDVKVQKPSILIFDEPTTGLSDTDVENLIVQLRKLADRGHTLVVIEHHLGMIASADYLIEVGPEAAEEGGEIVYQGIPERIKKVKNSLTAKFLN